MSSMVGHTDDVSASSFISTGSNMIPLGIANRTSTSTTSSFFSVSLLGGFFGRFPKDILLLILEYAVVSEIPITPFSVRKKSNKFIQKVVDPVSGNICVSENSDSILAMPRLMATCKTFYTILNESAPFYRLNKFIFQDHRETLCYLSSITPARLKDLRDIEIRVLDWAVSFSYIRSLWLHTCNILSTCTELRNLTIEIYDHTDFIREFLEMGLKKVRCSNLKIVCTGPAGELTEDMLNSYKIMTSGHPAQLTEDVLSKARVFSGVYIHGDGRISNEAKPNQVSSRTRAGRARDVTVDSDGIPQVPAKPKLDVEGQLNWDMKEILNHRQVTNPDTHQNEVEFLVKWKPQVGEEAGATFNLSWETLDLLLTNIRGDQNIRALYKYYSKYRCNYPYGLWETLDGAKQIHDAIVKQRRMEKDGGANCAPSKSLQNDFARGIKNGEKDRERTAVEAQKAAAKAEKAAAKAQKKSTKGRKAVSGKATSGKAVAGQKRKRGE